MYWWGHNRRHAFRTLAENHPRGIVLDGPGGEHLKEILTVWKGEMVAPEYGHAQDYSVFQGLFHGFSDSLRM